MEILNNIWNVFNTSNMELINYMLIPASIIEAFLTLMLFIGLLNIKSSTKQKLLYIILSCICSYTTNTFLPSAVNIIANYLILFAIIYFIFNLGVVKTLIALFIPAIVFGGINVLLSNVYIKVLNISYEQTASVPIFRFFYILIMYFVIGLIIFILKHKNFKIKMLEDFDSKTKKVIILNFILGLFTIGLQGFIIVYYIDFANLFVTFSNFIVLFAYFCINLYSLNKVTKLTATTRELETSEAYNKSITVLYDNVKGFKHDFDNIVSAIGGYVETNDMEGLKEYYYSLREDCQKTNNIAILNPSIINNPAIYSILSSKYHKANNLGIKINLEFFVDLNEFDINSYEFSRILGILLDNAIEACSECEEKIINIHFRNEYNKNRNIIIISNTYKNKDINIDEIFEKGKSGKPNHSGLGLWEVRQYITKNNNLNLYTTKDDKYFTQQLEIYYNKK